MVHSGDFRVQPDPFLGPRTDEDGLRSLGDRGVDLALVDSFLRGYAEWHDKMDAWAVIGIDDLSHVCAWRTQAEQQRRSKVGY